MKKVTVIGLILLGIGQCSAAIITVDDDGPADFDNIQAAINSAGMGDSIIVQPGLYTGTGNRDIDFSGKAITVRSADPNDPCTVAATVIDCNGTDQEYHRGFIFQTGEDANSILSGFTICNGYHTNGGGIACINSSPSISNCVIRENNVAIDEGKGGGVYCESSGLRLRNFTILNNRAAHGGGIYGGDNGSMISSCTIGENSEAYAGGGISNCAGLIRDCNISGNWAITYGGGLYNCDGEIRNCTISENYQITGWSDAGGGGMSHCDGLIVSCNIRDNDNGGYGAGLAYCNGQVLDCNISNNYSSSGDCGGLYECNGSIIDCTVSHNGAYFFSGGLLNCNALIKGCIISYNWSEEGLGGGLINCDGIIEGCSIIHNRSKDLEWYEAGFGGGLLWCDGIVRNCLIADNQAFLCDDGGGGGLYACNADILNCTIVNNSAVDWDNQSSGGGLADCHGSIENCIIAFNTADVNDNLNDTVEPSYSFVEGLTASGLGNIDGDPCFVDAWNSDLDLRDYHLLPGSPCIDAGNNEAVPPGAITDLDGQARFFDDQVTVDSGNGTPPIVDVGAYEYAVLYVDVNSPNDPGTGDINDPFRRIQDSIDAAINGNTVMVLDGTYTGTGNRDITFRGKALTVCSVAGPATCIVDCQGSANEQHRGFIFHDSETRYSILRGFTVLNGYMDDGAGGIDCIESCPTIDDCVISGNTGTTGGIYSGASAPLISNCSIIDNVSISEWGTGGILCRDPYPGSEMTMVLNCVIASNTGDHGGIYIDHLIDANILISNCTVVYNSGVSYGGVCFKYDNKATVENSILWENAPEAIYTNSDPLDCPIVRYCDVEGDWVGAANMNADPLLADHANGDYHLLAASPCIDAGDPCSPFDLELEPNGGRVNMGAYGNTAEATPTVDSDGDGIMDPQETRWGLNPDSNDSDADGLTDNYEVCYDGDCSDYQPYPAGSDLNAGSFDTDGDGMDDGWEMLYPGCVNAVNGSDGGSDCDNDGFTNWRECRYRTSPSDANSKPVSEAITIIVDDDGPADFNNIQAAIDSSIDGDTVIVNPGVYMGTGNRDIDFLGKAMTVQSIDPDNPDIVAATVVDCQGTEQEYHRGFIFENGEDTNSILSGLTIRNGYHGNGGGIACINSSPRISNCVITNNLVDEDQGKGGGVYCEDSAAELFNCTITHNDFAPYGGAVYGCGGAILGCTIARNSECGFGAGLANFEGTIVDCIIEGNNASCCGGGLYQCDGPILNCIIRSNGATGVYPAGGGGLWDCDGEIRNCQITGNVALDIGGGLGLCDGSIIDTEISDNYAFIGDGGGLYQCNGFIQNCRIANNGAYFACGGALQCAADFENCIIENNWAEEGSGGGLSGCNGNITGCVIRNNRDLDLEGGTPIGGGGLYACDGHIVDCIITNNYCCGDGSTGGGGGLSNCDGRISNCVITDNRCYDYWDIYGGGLYECNALIENCTIINNTAYTESSDPSCGGGLYQCTGEVRNCIVWGNIADQGSQFYGYADPNYSCIQDWIGGGFGNTSADPLFADPCQQDYHLKSAYGRWDVNLQRWVYDNVTSPCIDTGDPSSDWTGELWPNGGRINMGAYGGTSEASMSASGPGNPIDVDNSGRVNLEDYSVVAAQWHAGQARTIPHGQIAVDGNLSDWPQDAQWIPLDKIYYGDPCDVNTAKFTLCWNQAANRIYAAVVVNDSEHTFTNGYVSWNAGDRLEIYSQGSAAGGGGFWHPTNPEWDSAQQYMVGPNNAGGCWASWGTGGALPPDVGLQCAISVDGDTITYEIAVTPYENYGHITGDPTVITPLAAGRVVAFDLIVDTKRSGGFGMLSENLMLEKYHNADSFRRCTISSYILAPPYEPFAGDINRDQVVDEYDLQAIAENWLE